MEQQPRKACERCGRDAERGYNLLGYRFCDRCYEILQVRLSREYVFSLPANLKRSDFVDE